MSSSKIPTPRTPPEGTTPRKYPQNRRMTRSVRAKLEDVTNIGLIESAIVNTG